MISIQKAATAAVMHDCKGSILLFISFSYHCTFSAIMHTCMELQSVTSHNKTFYKGFWFFLKNNKFSGCMFYLRVNGMWINMVLLTQKIHNTFFGIFLADQDPQG
jgi:hypothetical protein